MPTVSSDLVFVHQIFKGKETLYLESWDQFYFSKTVTGSAGNAEAFEIRNPAASNVIAVLERAWVSEATTDTFSIARGKTNTDQPTSETPSVFDSRGRSSSTCVVSDNDGAAITVISGLNSFQFAAKVLGNTPYDYLRAGDELVINPGFAYLLQSTNVATAVTYMFQWRERFLEEPERI